MIFRRSLPLSPALVVIGVQIVFTPTLFTWLPRILIAFILTVSTVPPSLADAPIVAGDWGSLAVSRLRSFLRHRTRATASS